MRARQKSRPKIDNAVKQGRKDNRNSFAQVLRMNRQGHPVTAGAVANAVAGAGLQGIDQFIVIVYMGILMNHVKTQATAACGIFVNAPAVYRTDLAGGGRVGHLLYGIVFHGVIFVACINGVDRNVFK